MKIQDGVRSGHRGHHRGRTRSLASAVAVVSALSLAMGGAVAGASVKHSATPAAKGKLTAAQVATITADLAAARKPSHWQAGGPAVNAKTLKGKTLFLLDDLTNQFTNSLEAGVIAAGKAAGMTVKTGDGGSDITRDVQVLDNAVNAHVDVILLLQTPSLVGSALLKAKAAGIPVVVMFNGDPHLPTAAEKALGVVADANYCYSCTGKLAAEYEILKHGGVVHSQVSQFTGAASSDTTALGWTSTLKAICPKTCTTTYNNESLSGNFVQQTQNATQVAAQGHEINVMFPVYDFLMGFMLPTLTAAGAQNRIDLASENADLAQMQELKAGTSVKANVGNPVAWDGWGAVDQAIRVMKHLPPVKDELVPVRLFDPTNINSLDLAKDPSTWFGAATYGLDYEKLWKIR
jgi:ribose transport system substrate-binding protein